MHLDEQHLRSPIPTVYVPVSPCLPLPRHFIDSAPPAVRILPGLAHQVPTLLNPSLSIRTRSHSPANPHPIPLTLARLEDRSSILLICCHPRG